MTTEIRIHKNPVVDGCYADPEARFYNGKYYIYVTRSRRYEEQRNLDAFSSTDLIHFEKHEDIIDMKGFERVKFAAWAPTIIEKENKYYLIFACNDIQKDEQVGGLEIAVSEKPEGPFVNHSDHLLIGKFINGAQPIDAHLFKDDDGTIYLYYGGWKHCNVCKMNQTMDGFEPFEDGELFKEITPVDYVEGPCMLKDNGLYYFMWSSGSWGDGTYRVDYCTSQSPIGPFTHAETILSAQKSIGDGPGHNGYVYCNELKEYVMVYHRRKVGDKERDHRYLCIDRLPLQDGKIGEVKMTDEWQSSVVL